MQGLDHSSLMYMLAGIGLFMYGMTLASKNLQRLSANRIREALSAVSDKPFVGILVGIFLTLMIQSSGAVTAMLVGLGTAGVVTLRQVMSVLLGTTIGTTLTVQLLSFNVAQFGLPIFSISFFVYFLTSNKKVKQFMSVWMGFGMIFWGLEFVSVGTQALKSSPLFLELLGQLKEFPVYTILLTAIFTAVVHSSAVTIGFAMTLASGSLISSTDAMYWVYGANIGTTATALMASFGGNYVGRQVAWAHFFYKIASVFVFIFFTNEFIHLIQMGNPARTIANAHTLFNIIAAGIFLPFINYGAKWIEKLFQPLPSEREFSVKYLQKSNFENLNVGMAQAERECMRMADIVISMVKDSVQLFKMENRDLEDSIRERDNRVDLLNKEISLFLAHFADGTGPTPKQILRVMSFSTDLESVGDVIDNSILDLAKKKNALKLTFSDQGLQEIGEMHSLVLEAAQLSASCFQLRNKELASRVIYLKRRVRELEKSLRESHLDRLAKGIKESKNTSSIHLDVLSEYRRIAGLMCNHVYGIFKSQENYYITPRRES